MRKFLLSSLLVVILLVNFCQGTFKYMNSLNVSYLRFEKPDGISKFEICKDMSTILTKATATNGRYIGCVSDSRRSPTGKTDVKMYLLHPLWAEKTSIEEIIKFLILFDNRQTPVSNSTEEIFVYEISSVRYTELDPTYLLTYPAISQHTDPLNVTQSILLPVTNEMFWFFGMNIETARIHIQGATLRMGFISVNQFLINFRKSWMETEGIYVEAVRVPIDRGPIDYTGGNCRDMDETFSYSLKFKVGIESNLTDQQLSDRIKQIAFDLAESGDSKLPLNDVQTHVARGVLTLMLYPKINPAEGVTPITVNSLLESVYTAYTQGNITEFVIRWMADIETNTLLFGKCESIDIPGGSSAVRRCLWMVILALFIQSFV